MQFFVKILYHSLMFRGTNINGGTECLGHVAEGPPKKIILKTQSFFKALEIYCEMCLTKW